MPEIPVVAGERGSLGAGYTEERPRPGALDQPAGSSGGQRSLEASPARPARARSFPTAHSQGAVRPQNYSSPRLRPRLGLMATLQSPRGPPKSTLQVESRENLTRPQPLQNRSPPSRSLPGHHGPRHQFPATSLPATAPCLSPSTQGRPERGQGRLNWVPGAPPHKTVCTRSLVKGTDPRVTPDLDGGSPTSGRGRDSSP